MNIQCISNKINILDLFLSNKKPAFLCLTEHWAGQHDIDHIDIMGYKKVSYFFRQNHLHGGSIIFVKSEISKKCENLKYICDLSTEMCVEISAISYEDNLCVICIYKPPDGNNELFFMCLSETLTRAMAKFKNIILCGDLNIKSNTPEKKETKILHDIFDSHNLVSLVKEHTRITNKTSSSIDYLVTNVNDVQYENLDPGISDHHCQILLFNESLNTFPVEKSKTRITHRDINKQSVHEFKTLFNREYTNSNQIHSFNTFFENFRWCFEVAFPLKEKTLLFNNEKNKKIAFSDELLQKLEYLKNIKWLKDNYDDDQIRIKYKQERNYVNKVIKLEKQNYYNNIIENSTNKTKTLWSIVNNSIGRSGKEKTKIVLKNNELEIANSLDIANKFGSYFSTAVPDMLTTHFGNDISDTCTIAKNSCSRSMFFTPVTAQEIQDIIQTLPNKKSTGYDHIPVTLIKECSIELSQPLADMINHSVLTGEFPSPLKIACLVPIFKKGDPSNEENYRPIALLSIFSKIMEKAIAARITSFLSTNKTLNEHQHGFRENHSTETATADLIQYIYEKLDKNERVLCVFFDLSRAFDTVEPKFVEQKIKALGIREPISKWILSYLTNRKFMVKIDNIVSNEFETDIGTPQGGVLGPLIFLLYVNDLPSHIGEGRLFMYADDSTLVMSDSNAQKLEEKANTAVQNFNNRCRENRLIINYEKTICMQFHTKQRSPDNYHLNIEEKILRFTHSTVFLGVTIDKHLSWTEHIDQICGKLNKSYFAILTLKNNLQTQLLITVYYALVYPLISYNIIAWGQSSSWDRVFLQQKRIIRLIFNIPYGHTCRNVYKQNNILTVISIYLLKLLTFVHKNKNSFKKQEDYHNYFTRDRKKYEIQKHSHTFFERSPRYAGIQYYNMLPEDIKLTASIVKFKNKLKKILINNTPYTLDEFKKVMQNS